MIDPEEATPQQLGEALAAQLGSVDWEVDVDAPALPVEEPIEDIPPIEEAVPIAEAVNEEEVPPAPLQIIEAMLFIGGPPLSAAKATDSIRGFDAEQFRSTIETLNRVYRMQNRPYTVTTTEQGCTLTLRPRFAGLKERLYGGPREARLTQQALDVLSLVTYRQPVAKAEVDSVRGMESGAVLRQLIRLGLISISQRADAKKREVSYSTTPRFLELFNLKSLEDLPQTGDAQRL